MKVVLYLFGVLLADTCFANTFVYDLDPLDSRSFYSNMTLFKSERELINDTFYWDTRILSTSNNAFTFACKARRHISTIHPLSATCTARFNFELSDENETHISYGKFENSVSALINNLSDSMEIVKNFGSLSTFRTEEQALAKLPDGRVLLYPTFYISCKKEDIGTKCSALVVPR